MAQAITDTHPEADAVQLTLLRNASVSKRAGLVRALTRMAVANSKRAIEQANPQLSQPDHATLFIQLNYGEQWADRIRGTTRSMTGNDLFQAMVPVLQALDELGVPHYIGGSVASSAYGLPRSTLDADLIAALDVSHVQGLVSALSAQFYVSGPMIRQAIENESCFNVIHLATMFKVDIFTVKSRPFDRWALTRIRRHNVGEPGKDLEVWLASPEDVVLNKLEWYRKGNEVSERQWTDILGVLKVQHASLDRDYLRHWANELGVLDLLQRALADANP